MHLTTPLNGKLQRLNRKTAFRSKREAPNETKSETIMKRALPWRNKQSSEEPTPEQLKAAENAVFSAMRRGNAILSKQPSFQERMIMMNDDDQPEEEREVDDVGDDPASILAKTSVGDFISNFRVNGLECMTTAYEMTPPLHQSPVSGSITTALPEDLFHLIGSQLSLLDEYLKAKCTLGTETGNSITVEAVLSIVRNLWYHHQTYRYTFLRDVESSIAAANDLMRMLDKLEEMMGEVERYFPRLNWKEDGKECDSTTAAVRREVADLASIYSSDAVNACHRAVNYIMINIQSSHISSDLFSQEWEDVMTHNQVAISIVKTFEDYLTDIRNYIEHDFLYQKMVAASVRATVCFYTQSFVKKAHKMRRAMAFDFAQQRARKVAFLNPKRAITRITHDVQVFRDYFQSLVKGTPALSRLVSDELSIFVVLIECMWLAVGRGAEDQSFNEFVVVVHKKISGANSAVTRHFLSDLWLLMGPKNEHHTIEKEIKMMDAELKKMSARVKEGAPHSRTTIDQSTYLRLDEVLRVLYEDRILQENSFFFGGMMKHKPGHQTIGLYDESPSANGKPWDPLKGIRKRMTSTKCERELSKILKNMN